MRIKTSELTGPALRWAVANAECRLGLTGLETASRVYFTGQQAWCHDDNGEITRYEPDEDWSQGGPIIERERLLVEPEVGKEGTGNAWCAITLDGKMCYGSTFLIAAMRCYVASKLGDEVEIPDELA